MQGKRTYIVGVGIIIFGVILFIQGQQEQGLSRIGEGLGLIFLRAGLANK